MPFAISSTIAGRAPALLRHGRRIPQSLSSRSFSSAAVNASVRPSLRLNQSKRLGTVTILRSYSAAVQEAPNPKAYLDSGVIKPKEHVDVKKVLVIGSGGLAIGQAGEFDYSGKSIDFLFSFALSISH